MAQSNNTISLAVEQPKIAPHVHTHDGCCGHAEEIQKSENMLLLYLIGGVLLIAAFLGGSVFSQSVSRGAVDILALIAAVVLGVIMLRSAWREILAGKPGTSSLASLAIIASIADEKYQAAGWLALVLLIADQFLRRTSISAKRVIEELVKLTPNIARVVRDNAESEIPLSQVKLGDIVRVRPGENLSVDGIVVSGRSTIDQASLTGESAPHEVTINDPVYAGTTNLTGSLDLRATQVGSDTTIGKVSQLIASAEKTKTPRQLLIEQVAAFYVPVAISLAFLAWFLTNDVSRAINVLIVACPGALLLASPTAMVAAFASGARLGVMIKEPKHLEAAADVDTVVFDKTGTITTGKFAVARLSPATGIDPADLLAAAAAADQHSNHPLAKSIVATAAAARVSISQSTDYQEIHGRGVTAQTNAGKLFVGRASWLLELFPHIKPHIDQASTKIEGMTGVHVARDGTYLGVVGLEDKIRPATKSVMDKLRDLGTRKLAIFTGDRLSVAERVGRAVGVDHVEAECLPEEKHAEVKALTASGRKTLMVGDGINDGPSLASADVGVAMGLSGSDIATNSAGVALMNDDLSRIPFLIELARRNRAIIAQNIAISVIVALIGLALATSGKLEVWQALVFHFLGDILVIGNSFRLFRFGEAYSIDAPAEEQTAARRQGSMTLSTAQPA